MKDGDHVLMPKPQLVLPFPIPLKLGPGDNLRILLNGNEVLALAPNRELFIGALIGPLGNTEFHLDQDKLNHLKNTFGKEADYGITGL